GRRTKSEGSAAVGTVVSEERQC
ncbi:hypothetical protein AVDCRST_MAG81-1992, partial [uncultured Synechococcales cyanobacterium]